MCNKCVKAVRREFPNVKESEYGDLLMSCTCFPFGSAETIASQLHDLALRTDGSLESAKIIAADDFFNIEKQHELSRNPPPQA